MLKKNLDESSKEQFDTDRFFLRRLKLEDATNTYLEWMKDPTVVRFIPSVRHVTQINSINSYIQTCNQSENIKLFGIFVGTSSMHIGNIKFDVNVEGCTYAIVSILLGNSSWRGKGVFVEIFQKLSKYFYIKYSIKDFYLGVDPENIMAIKSYKKAGFVICKDHPLSVEHRSGVVMHFKISNLAKKVF